MQETTVDEIKNKAKDFSTSGKKWHFHILTPECQLNEKGGYALVLENTTDNEAYVSYSDEPYMDIGKELVKLLHGDDVVKDDKEESQESKPSPQVQEILKRAKRLNNQGKSWHHHMLFPGCRFNKHSGKWAIIFEDKEAGEVIESVSDDEPKGDLKHIETLFYQQKKAE
jgi:hypothetical protein